jgi:hypothetical protein
MRPLRTIPAAAGLAVAAQLSLAGAASAAALPPAFQLQSAPTGACGYATGADHRELRSESCRSGGPAEQWLYDPATEQILTPYPQGGAACLTAAHPREWQSPVELRHCRPGDAAQRWSRVPGPGDRSLVVLQDGSGRVLTAAPGLGGGWTVQEPGVLGELRLPWF